MQQTRRRWSRYDHVIAIDPGSTTGVAIYDTDAHELECRTLDFWRAADLADEFMSRRTAVLIEDPSYNKPTFEHGEAARRKREKISQNVGQNKQDATRLIERFDERGFDVKGIRPTGKKWTKKVCRLTTGYDRTPNNQHVRDALRLLFQQGVI